MGTLIDEPVYRPLLSAQGKVVNIAGDVMLSAAVVVNRHEHTHTEIQEPMPPESHFVVYETTGPSSQFTLHGTSTASFVGGAIASARFSGWLAPSHRRAAGI